MAAEVQFQWRDVDMQGTISFGGNSATVTFGKRTTIADLAADAAEHIGLPRRFLTELCITSPADATFDTTATDGIEVVLAVAVKVTIRYKGRNQTARCSGATFGDAIQSVASALKLPSNWRLSTYVNSTDWKTPVTETCTIDLLDIDY